MINKYTGMLLIILASIQSYAQSINSSVLDAEDRYRQNSWVDSVYNQMTLEEKVGQLIIVFTDSTRFTFPFFLVYLHMGRGMYNFSYMLPRRAA